MKIFLPFILFTSVLMFQFIQLYAAENCDRSTPEKFYINFSWCSEDPVNGITAGELYEEVSAKAIDDYDAAAFKSIKAYNTFREKVKTGFSSRYTDAAGNKFKVSITPESKNSSTVYVNWKFNVTTIMEAIRLLAKSDVVFHEAVCKGDNCLSLVAISGERKNINLVKTPAGYRIKLDEKDIIDFNKITVLLNELTDLFNSFSAAIDKGVITEKNFSETMLEWKTKFENITSKS